jgi:hypothetical protein
MLYQFFVAVSVLIKSKTPGKEASRSRQKLHQLLKHFKNIADISEVGKNLSILYFFIPIRIMKERSSL